MIATHVVDHINIALQAKVYNNQKIPDEKT